MTVRFKMVATNTILPEGSRQHHAATTDNQRQPAGIVPASPFPTQRFRTVSNPAGDLNPRQATSTTLMGIDSDVIKGALRAPATRFRTCN